VKGAEKLELPTPEKRMNITAKSYLAHRGFNPEKLEQKYKIFIGSYLNRDYKFRIIIPIIYEEKPVSFIGRDYTGKQIPKYKCPKREQEVIHHKDILYNLDNCDKDFCIVVEGVFDCWKIGDDCCATFGTSWSEKQAILLSKRFNKICILYDNDETGVSKGSLLKGFLEMCGVQVIQIMSTENSKNDPGEYTEKEARKVKRRIIHILQNI
jgi:DNA primase